MSVRSSSAKQSTQEPAHEISDEPKKQLKLAGSVLSDSPTAMSEGFNIKRNHHKLWDLYNNPHKKCGLIAITQCGECN